MVKKKKKATVLKKPYRQNPFNSLKGFTVSDPSPESPPVCDPPPVPDSEEPKDSFSEEMTFLGVEPLIADNPIHKEPILSPDSTTVPVPELADDEAFVAAIGPLDVRFSDEFPQERPLATPRRLKQLKRGQITPDASLDLHGLQRHQVRETIKNFIQDACYQKWQTLLVVTGRGLHSASGETPLRDEAEGYLRTEEKTRVAEWCRAPRQYGGDGALVVFLKKSRQPIRG